MIFPLREYMWVRYMGYIGILVEINVVQMLGLIHIVRDDGTTAGEVSAYLPSISQARYTDIPLPRRPDEVSARSLGYV